MCVARRDVATQVKECVCGKERLSHIREGVCGCGKERWSHTCEGVCVWQGEMEPHKGRIECVARRDGAT